MSPPPPPVRQQKEPFRAWLRRELWRETKLSLLFLAAGCTLVLSLGTLWGGFEGHWDRLNDQLTYVALEQHPVALVRNFASRLGDSEYGWGLFSVAEPANVTSARAQLKADFPEVYGLDASGAPQFRPTSQLKRLDPAVQKQRAAAYQQRHEHLEARRFSRLYQADDPFNPTDAGTKLARMITKLCGVPDAILFTLRGILETGVTGILLFSTMLALAGVALWQSNRPARRWLKALVWPTLASTLVWLAIAVMSVSAALFGRLTPNTSALAVLTALPFLFLAAKLPLRYAESLVLTTPAPRKWDGVERRQPRPPEPKPGETIPPLGGA